MDPKAICFVVIKIDDDGKEGRPFLADSNDLINLLCMSTIDKKNHWIITRVTNPYEK
jgi:hypothetical protein